MTLGVQRVRKKDIDMVWRLSKSNLSEKMSHCSNFHICSTLYAILLHGYNPLIFSCPPFYILSYANSAKLSVTSVILLEEKYFVHASPGYRYWKNVGWGSPVCCSTRTHHWPSFRQVIIDQLVEQPCEIRDLLFERFKICSYSFFNQLKKNPVVSYVLFYIVRLFGCIIHVFSVYGHFFG